MDIPEFIVNREAALHTKIERLKAVNAELLEALKTFLVLTENGLNGDDSWDPYSWLEYAEDKAEQAIVKAKETT